MRRFDIQRIGGACAILYTILVLVFMGLLFGSGFAEAKTPAEFLPLLDRAHGAGLAISILLIILPLLIAVAGLGFFQMLQQAGSLTWAALFCFVGGGVAVLYRGFTWTAITLELAPAYVEAGADQRASLLVLADTLQSFAYGADLAGGVLIGGIGVWIYSLAMRRANVGARWVTRVGVFAAVVGGWMTLLNPISEVFELINMVGAVCFFVWMVAVGITAWRAPMASQA